MRPLLRFIPRLVPGLCLAGAWLGGHYLLAGLLPGGGNAGSDLGLTIFVILTSLAVERAERLRSPSFAAWFLAGLVLSLVLGSIFWSSTLPPP